MTTASNESKRSKSPTLTNRADLFEQLASCRGMLKQHIRSFDHFIEHGIKRIVKANNYVRSEALPNVYLRYRDVRIGYPSVTNPDGSTRAIGPHECRLREMTYSAKVFADIEYIRRNERLFRKDYPIGEIPIMLRSCRCSLRGRSTEEMIQLEECPLDPGGYFIVRGTERVILIQEQPITERILVENDESSHTVTSSFISSSDKAITKLRIFVNTKKIEEGYLIRHGSLREDIPVCVVMRALGVQSDREIMSLVGYTRSDSDHNSRMELKMSFSLMKCHSLRVFTQNQALAYIGKRVRNNFKVPDMPDYNLQFSNQDRANLEKQRMTGMAFVLHHFMNHIEVISFNLRPKALLLAHMLNRAIMVERGIRQADDRDHYINKKLELAGELCAFLFEDVFKRMNFDLQSSMNHEAKKKSSGADFDVLSCLRTNLFAESFIQSISKGNWKIQRFRMDRSGVTEVVSRLSYTACLGMLTRINGHLAKSMKTSGPRALQVSQWGLVCPVDTPEGEACGLVKNLALVTEVTNNLPMEPVKQKAFLFGALNAQLVNNLHENYPVILNGEVIGVTESPYELAKRFRESRRRGDIDAFVSIAVDEYYRCVQISCDSGRMCRPYIIVDSETGKPRLTDDDLRRCRLGYFKFDHFLSMNKIEFLDAYEIRNAHTALSIKQCVPGITHLELDSFSLMSVCANIVPYSNHNQAPRNTYQCAMGKQAMGAMGYNQLCRVDTLLHLLVSPQRPLVATRSMEINNYNRLPSGTNAIVAIMSFTGYDIEDALIMNRASLDRGFARSLTFKKEVTTLSEYTHSIRDRIVGPVLKEFERNGKVFVKPLSGQTKLDVDGMARVGSMVKKGDVLVNKFTPKVTTDDRLGGNIPPPMNPSNVENINDHYFPSPIKYHSDYPAYVDRVLITENERETLVKVLLRQTRTPEVGDKFSSRHGQKGVIGLIVPEEDMPFSEMTGMRPDIVMNPHGFPSRMTVAKLIELVSGKTGLLEGKFQDASAFQEDPVKHLTECLLECGYDCGGKELLMSGQSGYPFEAYIFFGPIYYQRLKHMVMDKIHARATGPTTSLTRQPTEGRSRDGGLRLGEMERDCLLSHGTSLLLNERLSISCDLTKVDVCGKCGYFGYSKWCTYCQNSDNMHIIGMPYACKLLFQELLCMGIAPKIALKSVARGLNYVKKS